MDKYGHVPAKKHGALITMLCLCCAVVFLAGTPRLKRSARQTSHKASQARSNSQNSSALDIQVLLDRAGFSPGEIDGRWGRNMRQAITAFQEARGLSPTGTIDSATRQALSGSAAGETLVQYEITAEDISGPFLDKIPTDLMQQSKLPGLYYTSPLEKMGEKFHVKPLVLQKLNPRAKFTAGEQIMAPNVLGSENSDAGPSTNPDRGVPAKGSNTQKQAEARRLSDSGGGVTVTVSRSESALSVQAPDGKVIFRAPATSGSKHDPLPLGKWKVTAVQKNPPFHYNPALFWDANPKHIKAKIPPGPNNPVGVVWIDISKEHYGIHGTPEPGRIGYTQSHGCVRLTNWDAMRVARLVKPGTTVLFVE